MTRALAACLLLALTGCATLPAPKPVPITQPATVTATPDTLRITFTVPRFQAARALTSGRHDDTACCPSPFNLPAHARWWYLVAFERVPDWQAWPVGWTVPVAESFSGPLADSLAGKRMTLTNGRDFYLQAAKVYSLALYTVGASGAWSCGSNPITVEVP